MENEDFANQLKAIENEEGVIMTEASTTFEDWINRPYISAELKNRLRAANLLLVPVESWGDREGLTFPENTDTLFQFLKDNAPKELVTEICIEDEDYAELSLRSYWLVIANVLVELVLVPVALYSDPICQDKFSPCLRWSQCQLLSA